MFGGDVLDGFEDGPYKAAHIVQLYDRSFIGTYIERKKNNMWTYIVSIIILLISLFTSFGIFVDTLNSQTRTATRGFFWVGVIVSLFILLIAIVTEMSKLPNG